jgi:hypothetical protein
MGIIVRQVRKVARPDQAMLVLRGYALQGPRRASCESPDPPSGGADVPFFGMSAPLSVDSPAC